MLVYQTVRVVSIKWSTWSTPIARWFIMENTIKLDYLGVPLFRKQPYKWKIRWMEEILHQLVYPTIVPLFAIFVNSYH